MISMLLVTPPVVYVSITEDTSSSTLPTFASTSLNQILSPFKGVWGASISENMYWYVFAADVSG